MTVAGSCPLVGEEVTPMSIAVSFLFSFLVSVAAGIAANILYGIICKWLNGRRK